MVRVRIRVRFVVRFRVRVRVRPFSRSREVRFWTRPELSYNRRDRAAGAALKLHATSLSCYVIRCVRPGRVCLLYTSDAADE